MTTTIDSRRMKYAMRGGGLVALMFALVPVQAQQTEQPAAPAVSEMLTLERALEVAEMKSEPITIARAGISRADADIIRAHSNLRPQLSASASYDRLIFSEFDDVFSNVSGPTCAPFTLNPSASLDARVGEIERAIDCGAVGSGFFGAGSSTSSTSTEGLNNLPFGRPNTWRAGLTFSQNLYSGGRNGAQETIATVGRQSADLTLTTTRGQLFLDVSTAYYDVALSSRLVAIAEATLEQANATLRQVQAGFDAGTQPEFEVLRARVNRDSQAPVLIRQQVNRATATLRLKQLLDLPAATELQLPDVLADEALPPPGVFAPRVVPVEQLIAADPSAAIARGLEGPLPERAAVSVAEADVRRTEAALSLAVAQKMPSASINSSYSRVGYPSGVFPFSNFRNNWTIGASVQVPVLTGGRQKGDEAVARADLEESRARLQQTRELSGLDTRLAWAELLASLSTWQATAGTVQQATRAYEIADVRYRAGVSTQLELSDARLQLQQAQANRAQAARDVQVARARVALLPDLPLSTGGAPVASPAAARTTPAAQPVNQQPQTAASPFQSFGGQGAQTGR
jgi:outer membrane protein TolC